MLCLGFFEIPAKTGQETEDSSQITTSSLTTEVTETIPTPSPGIRVTTIPIRETTISNGSSSSQSPRGDIQLLQPANKQTPGAGRLPLFKHFWQQVTTNSFVLKVIEFGYRLQFFKLPPLKIINSGNFSSSRISSVSKELSILYSKTAIVSTTPSPDQFVSPIFDVPKKNSDKRRVILNLKFLNNYIIKSTFKLEDYNDIINMVRKGDYFVSIDLCDAYLMILIHPSFWRYLCFDWLGLRYHYRCMPFGLTSSPRIFTKIFKQVLTFLRSRGLRISAFFDDILLVASSIELLLEHLHFTMLTLKSLGFLPHPEKSMLTPSQSINHLGFQLNSIDFTLSVPEDKVAGLKTLCRKTVSGLVKLRFLNKILGTIENFRIAFPYAALHYRGIQKDVALYISRRYKWDDSIILSERAVHDINWWLQCPMTLTPKSLEPFLPSITLTTDSSENGWGGISSNGKEVSGFWSKEECSFHINILETKAVILAFRSLFRNISNVSILIRSDNTTTVAYINNMGGVKSQKVTKLIIELYEFCIEKGFRIQATHLSGRLNVQADALSRRSRDHCYSLPSPLFSILCEKISFTPLIDLFASRINTKLKVYFSDGPDPFASGFDAFMLPWPGAVYAFPPIHLVNRFISSFMAQEIEFGLLICPFWPSQPYFSNILDMLIDIPFIISASQLEDASMLPNSVSRVMACSISTNCVLQMEFQRKLPAASSDLSRHLLYAHTFDAGSPLFVGALNNKYIYATFL